MTDVLTDIPPTPEAGRLPGRSGVVRGLAAVEFRETLTHPLTAAGITLSAALAYLYTGGALPILHGWDGLAPMFVAPLAAALAVVGHLAASRAARDATEPLVTTTPATDDQRVQGVLLGVAASAVAVSSVFVAAWVGWMVAIGGTGAPSVVELANGVAFAVVAGLAGAVTGVWISARFAGLLVVAALAVVQAAVGGLPPARAAWLGWWRTPVIEAAAELQPRPAGWHLLWLVALSAVVGGVGLLRSHRGAARWAVPVVGLVLAGVAGSAMLAPPGEQEVERYVDLATEPALDCRSDGAVEVCWLSPAYDRVADRWRSLAQATLAPIPDPPAVRIEQQLFGLRAVARELDADDDGAQLVDAEAENDALQQPPTPARQADAAAADDARILVRSSWSRPGSGQAGYQHLGLSLAVAQEATGLVPHREGCLAADQAREALSLWLAAQASPAAATHLRDEARSTESEPDQVFVPSYLHTGPEPVEGVIWTRTGAQLALDMLDHPDPATVRQIVSEEWQRWVDPSTPPEALGEPLGLEPAAPTGPGPASTQQFPTCR